MPSASFNTFAIIGIWLELSRSLLPALRRHEIAPSVARQKGYDHYSRRCQTYVSDFSAANRWRSAAWSKQFGCKSRHFVVMVHPVVEQARLIFSPVVVWRDAFKGKNLWLVQRIPLVFDCSFHWGECDWSSSLVWLPESRFELAARLVGFGMEEYEPLVKRNECFRFWLAAVRRVQSKPRWLCYPKFLNVEVRKSQFKPTLLCFDALIMTPLRYRQLKSWGSGSFSGPKKSFWFIFIFKTSNGSGTMGGNRER